jgi:hypothetical protein
MNRTKLFALAVVAVALAACSGAPSWNEAVFPNQPEYGAANTQTAKAEVPGE